MNSVSPSAIFATQDLLYAQRGYATIPVVPASKRSSPKGWTQGADLTPSQRDEWRREYATHGISLLAGTVLSTGRRLCFLDIDHDGFLPFVQTALGRVASAKFGSKGLTIFAQASHGLKKPETQS